MSSSTEPQFNSTSHEINKLRKLVSSYTNELYDSARFKITEYNQFDLATWDALIWPNTELSVGDYLLDIVETSDGFYQRMEYYKITKITKKTICIIDTSGDRYKEIRLKKRLLDGNFITKPHYVLESGKKWSFYRYRSKKEIEERNELTKIKIQELENTIQFLEKKYLRED